MSNPGKPTLNIPDIPGLTNYPLIATMVRNLIYGAAVAGSAAVIGFLNAKGFKADWLNAYLPFLIISALVALATFLWSLLVKYKTMIALGEHVLEAAQTGIVPDAVKAAAPASIQKQIIEAGK